ncbi:MAG TPA: hypothetical protein DCP92_11495 [Nitrospiraceae bacterium]|jgi:hypothetical protein|nr:hypothetical protein [Nitrospiraceae bacterium]
MTATKTARQKPRNNTGYYGYPLTCNVFEYVNKSVLADWVNIANIHRDKARINLIEQLIHSASDRAGVRLRPWRSCFAKLYGSALFKAK